MTKKRIFILLFAIVILFLLLVVFWLPISRIFKKKERLSLEDVTYYWVLSNEYSFEVRDSAGIEKITNFLNSLSLVKEEKMRDFDGYYLFDFEYIDPVKEDEIFYIWYYADTNGAISFCRSHIEVNYVTELGAEIRWCLHEIDIIIQISYNRHSKC